MKREILIIPLLLIGCWGVPGASDDVTLNHGAWTLDKARTAVGEYRNGHPFNGPFYDWWRTDLRALMFYKNGKLNGPVIAWYENGSRMFEGQMQENLKIGVWRHWGRDGKLLAEGEYKNGRPWNGVFIEGLAPPTEYRNGVCINPAGR